MVHSDRGISPVRQCSYLSIVSGAAYRHHETEILICSTQEILAQDRHGQGNCLGVKAFSSG